MEVFLAVKPEDDFALVERALEAWEVIEGCDPINVIQCPAYKFEVSRRVTADNMAAKELYILADIDCVPASRVELAGAAKRVLDEDGMIGLLPESEEDELPIQHRPRLTSPRGVRIIRKGVLDGWPEAESPSYDDEHADAVRQAGKRVVIWRDSFFKRLEPTAQHG